MEQIAKIPTRNDARERRHMSRKYIAMWIDDDIDLENEEFKKSLAQMQAVVSDVNICHTLTQCIQILNAMDQDKVFVILSDTVAEQLVPDIHKISRVHAIYIYFGSQVQNTEWTKDWRKIRGVFKSIESLCESLNKTVQMCDHNDIIMSFIPKETAIAAIATSTNEQVADQLPPSYMYSIIFKEIILEIDDDHDKQIHELVEYCRKNYVLESQLTEFKDRYHEKSPVWWYTRDTFVYRRINQALRTLDMEAMMKMGFFIRHLHLQLQQLHQEQLESFREKLTVYRGQALSEEDFQNLCATKGGLLSFNNFLSTSTEKDIVTFLAPNAIEPDTENIGIIFVITIDPNDASISTKPFAFISHYSAFPSEQEILFTMHTVFRVMDIKQSNENARLHEVQLVMTGENDPQLGALTERLKEEVDGQGWHRMGKLMLKLGHFDQAEELYNQLLEDATSDGDRGYIYHMLGILKYYQGEYQEAARFYEEYLGIKLKTVAEDDISLAPTYGNIGLVYDHMGEYSKALEFYEKSPRIYDKALPPNHPLLATSYNNIGLVYYNMGDYSKALEFYEKSHQIFEKALPPNHPDLAISYSNMTSVYKNVGDYSKALEFCEKSLKIREKALPPNHPDLATSYNNIGLVYENMGDYSKALEFYEKAHQILEKALPPNHPDLATSYNNIGEVYRNMGDYSKALKFFEKSLKILEKALPPNHPSLATSYNNIAAVYDNMGDYSKALKFYDKSLKIYEKALPPNHPLLATSSNNIGLVYENMGDYSKALEFYEESLKIRQQTLPSDHPDFAQSYNNIGMAYSGKGDYPKALQNLEKALTIRQKAFPPGHPRIKSTMNNIASVKRKL